MTDLVEEVPPDLGALRVVAVGGIRSLAERNGHGALGTGEVSGVTPRDDAYQLKMHFMT